MKPIHKFCNKLIYSILTTVEVTNRKMEELDPKNTFDINTADKLLYHVKNEIGWIESGCINRYLDEIEPPHPNILKLEILNKLLKTKKRLIEIIKYNKKEREKRMKLLEQIELNKKQRKNKLEEKLSAIKRKVIKSRRVVCYRDKNKYKYFRKVYKLECNCCSKHFDLLRVEYNKGRGKYCSKGCIDKHKSELIDECRIEIQADQNSQDSQGHKANQRVKQKAKLVKPIMVDSRMEKYTSGDNIEPRYKKIYIMECNLCHKLFEIPPGRYNIGDGKYCSSKCSMTVLHRNQKK